MITDPMAAPAKDSKKAKVTQTPLASELSALLNRHSRENASNTPDFILAEYVIGCLKAYEDAVNRRGKWNGEEVKEGKDHAD